MRNQSMFSIVLLSLVMLSGCENTQYKKQENKNAKTGIQDKTWHQRTHGASKAHQLVFIKEHDANSDEQVTKDEFTQSRTKRYQGMDIDNSQGVSEAEYLDEYASRLDQQIADERKWHGKQTLIRFSSLDKNQDDAVDESEWQGSSQKMWATFNDLQKPVVPETDNGKQNNYKKSIHRHKSKHKKSISVLGIPSSHNKEGFVAIYDTDGDKKVGQEEFLKKRNDMFALTDANHDKRIQQDEYSFEYESRVDQREKTVINSQTKQAKIRFDVLDSNDDQLITLKEFHFSGDRIFNGWDLNEDAVVNRYDELPTKKEKMASNAK